MREIVQILIIGEEAGCCRLISYRAGGGGMGGGQISLRLLAYIETLHWSSQRRTPIFLFNARSTLCKNPGSHFLFLLVGTQSNVYHYFSSSSFSFFLSLSARSFSLQCIFGMHKVGRKKSWSLRLSERLKSLPPFFFYKKATGRANQIFEIAVLLGE